MASGGGRNNLLQASTTVVGNRKTSQDNRTRLGGMNDSLSSDSSNNTEVKRQVSAFSHSRSKRKFKKNVTTVLTPRIKMQDDETRRPMVF
jgi:hypothetical protein